jgi:hypothetical protein
MVEFDYEKLKKEAEQYIKFEKDKKNRIAYITFDRPEAQNATSLGMRQNYADLIHKCNVDDDVKVVVIRGEGDDFGSGGDLPEQRPMLENPGLPLHHELAINDDDVKYPPGGSYRYLSTVTDFYAKARPATDRFKNFARSASSRPKAIATAGISTKPATPTWLSPLTTHCSATRRFAMWGGVRGCGGGQRPWACVSSPKCSSPEDLSPPKKCMTAAS